MSRWVKVSTIGLIVGMSLSAWTGEQAGVGLLLATVAGIIGQSVFPDRMRIGYTITFLLALMVGMFSYARTFEHWQSLPETFQFSGPVEIRERGEAKVFYRPVTLRPLSDDWSSGEVLYHAPIDFSIQPGERLSFSCSLIRPRNFEPGFDYRNLLASRGTGYTCERGGKWEVLDSDDFSLQGMLAAEQARLQEAISNLIPEPESGLLIGLLIGGGDNLAPETKSAFARAGLSHIVAVSGYNMSVVAEGLVLLALITGLWRRWAVSVAVVGLVFFLLIIDGSAASLRAAIMAWLAFGAYFIGRPAASLNGLLLAAAGMLLVNPLLIRYDVGFQLSFLATLALLLFTRHFETFNFFRHWYGKGAALFLTTIVIELFTLPVIIANFGTLSLIAPLANAVVLPLVPLAMFIGMGSLLITGLFPALTFLALPILWLPLALIIRLAEWFAHPAWASLAGLDIGAGFALGWYLGLWGTVLLLEKIRKRYVLGMDH